MILSQQVVSLPIAERLHKLGVKQESLWYYCIQASPKEPRLRTNRDVYEMDFREDYFEEISAFTCAELGEMLPTDVRGVKGVLEIGKTWENKWYCGYDKIYQEATNEADARGLMLCYLLENGIIKLEK